MLTYILLLHSFYALRHALAIRQLGSPEPGVDLLPDTREHLSPVLRALAFLSPRIRRPEFSEHHETVSVFIVTLGLGLAQVKTCVYS